MNLNKKLLTPIFLMGAVILLSNIAVAFPLGEWLTYGAFIYPLAFLVTDLTNRIYGKKSAQQVALIGFIWGVILSLIFADIRIVLASGTAFLLAQLLDISIFSKLRKQSWWKAPAISSLLASALDTFLFFFLAFAGTQIPWEKLALGDYLAKILMAIILLLPYKYILNWLQKK